MLTLTLWPEWAFAIVHLGKRVENRSLPFAQLIHRRVGDGWLAIHAGKNIGGRAGKPATREGLHAVAGMAERIAWHVRGDRDGVTLFRADRSVRLAEEEVTTSAVVAVARVRGVLKPGLASPWKVPESAAVRLHDVRVLSKPLPMGGSQGLWSLSPEQAETVLARAGVSHD